MEYNYEQLNTEYGESRKVSFIVKYIAMFLALIFAFIPLAELVREFDYNRIESFPVVTCIIRTDIQYQPLEFKELKTE